MSMVIGAVHAQGGSEQSKLTLCIFRKNIFLHSQCLNQEGIKDALSDAPVETVGPCAQMLWS